MFEISSLTLIDIIRNDMLFRVAIKNAIGKYKLNNNEDISTLSTILGANLRHRFLLEKLIKDEFGEVEGDERYFYSVIISDALFSKKIKVEEILKWEKKQQLNLEKDKLTKLHEKYSELSSIDSIKDELKEGKITEFEYLSIRYNTPMWLIKMWNKHFGKFLRPILKNNIHESDTSFGVNLKKISIEEVLSLPNFKKSSFDDMVLYSGKQTKSLDIVKNHSIYPLKEGERAIFDEIEINDDDKIVILSDQRGDNFQLKLFERINLTNWVKYITTSFEDYAKTRNIINAEMSKEKKDRNNFVSYRSDLKDYKTCLINDEGLNNYFILLPKSSNFDEIRRSPDYLIHFKVEELDELIQNQKSLIKEAVSYISNGGYIIYIVPTLDNKEGKNLIRDVIRENKNLSLVKERQYFPFNDIHSSLYFAILKKEALND